MSEAEDDALALWLRDDDPDEQRAGVGRTPAWQSAAFGVVAVLYLVTAAQGALIVVGDLLGWASDSFWDWAGSTTPSRREELRDDVLGLTVRGACLAGAGVVLGLWWRRRQMLAVSGAAVVVALVVGMTTYALAAEDQPDRPSWEDRPRVCQEHSGDGNDCPGG